MRFMFFSFMLLMNCLAGFSQHETILIEAEKFNQKEGWVVDQQFMDQMGSPYLLAHGLGEPVENASTTVAFKGRGSFRVFVRTCNWASNWTNKAPGQFQIALDDKVLESVLGVSPDEWGWVLAGTITVTKENYKLSLVDRTGFDARCDAIVFSNDPDFFPPDNITELTAWRKQMLNLPKKPESAGTFDFVVIGGGIAGTCAAISAARLGLKVALVQDRPVLGGNNSSEVRVHLGARIKLKPYPNLGNLVNEIGPLKGGNAQPADFYEDDKKLKLVTAENNITLFLNYHANKAIVKNGEIKQIIAAHIETGKELSFAAPLFADCTGDGTLGFLAGAEYMMGREGKNVYNEPTAPETGDKMTMGSSVQWFAEDELNDVSFPDIDWGLPWNEEKAEVVRRGDWDWETGMNLNQITDFERIRDYGLMVVYSNWSYVKNHSVKRDKLANSQLKWVAYIAGKRESRRLVGDYVLKEQDLVNHRVYPDGTAPTTWSIDLHYPNPENSALFPGNEFKSIAKHIAIYPYPIPFRCLYSKNITNLMMAGRNISATHVALGTVRIMRTTGMMGEVIGMAAYICKSKKTHPRGVYQQHMDLLIKLMNKGVGDPLLPNRQNYNLGSTKSE
jgi:hypothetical protein